MGFFIFNGTLLPAGAPVIQLPHTGVYFGEGIFETMLFQHGQIRWLNHHLERLHHGMNTLGLPQPELFSIKMVAEAAHQLLLANRFDTARIRITVTSKGKSIFDRSNEIDWLMEATSITPYETGDTAQEISLAIATNTFVPLTAYSGLKCNNFLHYRMAAKQCAATGADDVVLLNAKNVICETAIANIFFFNNNQWHTPALSTGCIPGVFRKNLLQFFAKKKIAFREGEFSLEELENSAAAFTTNCIRGIRPVKKIGSKFLNTTMAQQLHGMVLNEANFNFQ